MRWQKFMTILVLTLAFLPFQNCTQIVSFRVTGLENSSNKNSDSGGNGGTYDGKITFLHMSPGFECELQKAPKAILRRNDAGVWSYTVNEYQKCGVIKDQIVNDVVFASDRSTLIYKDQLFFQDNTAPEATNLNTYVNEYLIAQSGDPNTNDSNQGDGLCSDNMGRCSLRAAIEETNALPNKAHVLRLPSGTFNLTAPAIFTGDGFVGLYGEGQNATFIQNGGRTQGIFTTPSNYTSVLSLQDMHISGGASNSSFTASAINIYGSLYLNKVTLESNDPGSAGSPVIYAGVTSNSILIDNSRITQNATEGIRIFGSRSFILMNSEISDNTYTGFNVNNGTSNVHIVDSVITRNRDGVSFRECHLNCTIEGTSITQNLNYGLALYDSDDQYGDMIVRDSQLTGNGVMSGGNLYMDVQLRTVTFQLRLENSLVLNNGLPRPNCTLSGTNTMSILNIGTMIDDSTCPY